MRLHSVAFLFTVAVSFVLATGAHAAATPPNVLMIVIDDLNTTLGCYGDPVVKSPNIDRLAARGVRFDRAYSQYPLCNPSRVSMLTGLRPETTGVYRLNLPSRTAAPDAVTLPQLFRKNGYFTAGAGKVFHNANAADVALSWDSYQDRATEDDEEKAAINARYGGGDGRPAATPLTSDGAKTRDGVNTARIAGLIAERAGSGKPFFLAVGYHKPHLPWTAPQKFFDMYPASKVPPLAEPAMKAVPSVALQTELSGFPQPDSRAEVLRGYYACISFIDDEIGKLFAQLDRLKLWENTVVLLVSDNGFHLGDHGGLWAKLSAFDAATRVPLIVAAPGLPAGKTVLTPVELIDIYPTLAALAGQPLAQPLPGRSLVAVARGEKSTQPGFSLVYHYDPQRRRDIAGRTVIGPGYRYTEWDGGAARELYVHASDPREYDNRAGAADARGFQQAAERALSAHPAPKPGAANRPRALTKPEDRVN